MHIRVDHVTYLLTHPIPLSCPNTILSLPPLPLRLNNNTILHLFALILLPPLPLPQNQPLQKLILVLELRDPILQLRKRLPLLPALPLQARFPRFLLPAEAGAGSRVADPFCLCFGI